MPERKQLSREDWAAAALDALAADGLRGVAVEPLAVHLGATKGSFYWHFRNRDALIEAALDLWERRNTADVIAATADNPDPRSALRTLLSTTLGSVTTDAPAPSRTGHAVEVALQADARNPLVAAALDRVARQRLDHLTELFVRLGVPTGGARQRAALGLTAYLGQVQLARAAPDLLPRGPALDAYLDYLLDTLTGDSRTG
ncbi:TetR/AcrR family transcriptional regulator [Pseudonocardia phyllosphaerae]|uniref:TetR/AcrR family transcriptional regulator n=1 Tax=Pseudonocardia phyllosphaerae TaxID=3390502 RepID=UPI00397A36A1